MTTPAQDMRQPPDTEPPPSTTGARDSLSRTLWGIEWSRHLPRRIGRDVVVTHSSYDAALPFIREHYAAIFEEPSDSPFHVVSASSKARYYRASGDFFEFREGESTVGLLVGTPVDWSSYYLRSAAVIPSHQGKKVVQRFFPILFGVLADAGVERVEADTSPANLATLHLLTRLRFNVSGMVLTERWGAHVHFTRFLDEAAEATFLGQFCSGVKYQLRGRGDAPGAETPERRAP